MICLDRNRHGGGFVYVHDAISVGVLLSGPLECFLCSPNSTRKHCIALLYCSPSCPVSVFGYYCNALHFSRFTHIGDLDTDFVTAVIHIF